MSTGAEFSSVYRCLFKHRKCVSMWPSWLPSTAILLVDPAELHPSVPAWGGRTRLRRSNTCPILPMRCCSDTAREFADGSVMASVWDCLSHLLVELAFGEVTEGIHLVIGIIPALGPMWRSPGLVPNQVLARRELETAHVGPDSQHSPHVAALHGAGCASSVARLST